MSADAIMSSLEGGRIERIRCDLKRAEQLLDDRQFYALTLVLTGLVDTAVAALSSAKFKDGQDAMERICGNGDAA